MDKAGIFKIFKDQIEKKYLDKRFIELLFDNYDIILKQVKAKQASAFEFYEKRFLSITDEINGKPLFMA